MSGQDPNRNGACTDSRNISGEELWEPGGGECTWYLIRKGYPGAVSTARLDDLKVDVGDCAAVLWYCSRLYNVEGTLLCWNLGRYRSFWGDMKADQTGQEAYDVPASRKSRLNG